MSLFVFQKKPGQVGSPGPERLAVMMPDIGTEEQKAASLKQWITGLRILSAGVNYTLNVYASSTFYYQFLVGLLPNQSCIAPHIVVLWNPAQAGNNQEKQQTQHQEVHEQNMSGFDNLGSELDIDDGMYGPGVDERRIATDIIQNGGSHQEVRRGGGANG